MSGTELQRSQQAGVGSKTRSAGRVPLVRRSQRRRSARQAGPAAP